MKGEVVVGSTVIAGVVLSVMLGGSACGSPARGGPSSSSNKGLASSSASASSSSTVAGEVLRGVPVTAFDCPVNSMRGVGGVQVPAREVTEFLLCPMPSPHYLRAVTVVAGNVHFGPLIAALSAPDMPRSTGMCPMYADAVQVILARTRTGVMRATIPVDGCGHYQHLQVLMAARTS